MFLLTEFTAILHCHNFLLICPYFTKRRSSIQNYLKNYFCQWNILLLCVRNIEIDFWSSNYFCNEASLSETGFPMTLDNWVYVRSFRIWRGKLRSYKIFMDLLQISHLEIKLCDEWNYNVFRDGKFWIEIRFSKNWFSVQLIEQCSQTKSLFSDKTLQVQRVWKLIVVQRNYTFLTEHSSIFVSCTIFRFLEACNSWFY